MSGRREDAPFRCWRRTANAEMRAGCRRRWSDGSGARARDSPSGEKRFHLPRNPPDGPSTHPSERKMLIQYDNTELSLRTAWDWSVKWNLPLHPDKCCYLPIGQPQIAPLTFADGKSVEMVESATNLGDFIESSFKPSLQCKEAYARAPATFFMIRR